MHYTELVTSRKTDRPIIEREESLPGCPECGAVMAPNCLLFDEKYSDHESYQFTKAKQWLKSAQVIVFVGTSFSVQIINIAFSYASERAPPADVYNFNLVDNFPKAYMSRVHFVPVVGRCEDILPELLLMVS